jgi:hypothetical protein
MWSVAAVSMYQFVSTPYELVAADVFSVEDMKKIHQTF